MQKHDVPFRQMHSCVGTLSCGFYVLCATILLLFKELQGLYDTIASNFFVLVAGAIIERILAGAYY